MQSEAFLPVAVPTTNYSRQEMIVFVTFVTSYIWLWQRAFPGALWMAIGASVVFIIGSALRHGDTARAMGLRFDNLGRSLLEVSLVTLLVAALLLSAGWALGTLHRPEWWKIRSVGWHYFWAFIQQYALQAFVLLRIREISRNEKGAALGAAGLFAFLHLPNPPLTIMTFLIGWVWCRLFQRQPNLFVLALSHTILAIVTVHSFPREWMHSMKVGPGYFHN